MLDQSCPPTFLVVIIIINRRRWLIFFFKSKIHTLKSFAIPPPPLQKYTTIRWKKKKKKLNKGRAICFQSCLNVPSGQPLQRRLSCVTSSCVCWCVSVVSKCLVPISGSIAAANVFNAFFLILFLFYFILFHFSIWKTRKYLELTKCCVR